MANFVIGVCVGALGLAGVCLAFSVLVGKWALDEMDDRRAGERRGPHAD